MTDNPQRSLFFGVMGNPYESELCTSVLRLADAALRAGHRVIVWTCGGATTLTQSSIGMAKPRNLIDFATGRGDVRYPSTARFVAELIDTADGRLDWMVCRHCADERGAGEQIEGVVVASPFKFLAQMERADVAMVMGVK